MNAREEAGLEIGIPVQLQDAYQAYRLARLGAAAVFTAGSVIGNQFKRLRYGDTEPYDSHPNYRYAHRFEGITREPTASEFVDSYSFSRKRIRQLANAIQPIQQPRHESLYFSRNGQSDNSMPYRRKPRRYRRAKRYPKRYVTRRYAPKIQRNFISAGGMGMPKMIKMVHKYVTYNTINATSGLFAAHSYHTNALYDVDPTGVSIHQPMYFDQMAALYNRYTVVGSKIKITAAPTTSVPVIWGIFINDDTTSPATMQGAREQSTSTWKLWTSASPPSENTIIKKWSAKKYYGGSVLANPNISGTSSANPLTTPQYFVYAQSQDGSSTATVVHHVELTLIAIWKDNKDVPSST